MRIVLVKQGDKANRSRDQKLYPPSYVKELEEALGQCVLYSRLLARYDPDRKVYLAIIDKVYESVFEEEAGQILIQDGLLSLVTFDTNREELIRWVSLSTDYRQIIEKLLKEYADFLGQDDAIQQELVFDHEHDRYLLIEAG